MVSTRTWANSQTFPGNLVPVKLQDPFSQVISNNSNYHSWRLYTCQVWQGCWMIIFFTIHIGLLSRWSYSRTFPSSRPSLMKIRVIMWLPFIFGAHLTHWNMNPYSCNCFNVLLLGVPRNGTSSSIAQDTLLLVNWRWPSLTISSYLWDTMLAQSYLPISNRQQRTISLIISESGDTERV